MIKISSSHYVSASEVSEIKLSSYYDTINVTMKSGETHSIGKEYGSSSIYKQLEELVKCVDEELKQN